MNVKLYSNDCPRCKILKQKLDFAKIDFDSSNDLEELIEKGFSTLPALETDTKIMNFYEAIDWIKEVGEDTKCI